MVPYTLLCGYSVKLKKKKIEYFGHSENAQKRTVSEFDPHSRKWNIYFSFIFSFLRSAVQRSVEFRHPTRNTGGNSAESRERSLNTMLQGSLCLPYYVRDIVWSWRKKIIEYFGHSENAQKRKIVTSVFVRWHYFSSNSSIVHELVYFINIDLFTLLFVLFFLIRFLLVGISSETGDFLLNLLLEYLWSYRIFFL